MVGFRVLCISTASGVITHVRIMVFGAESSICSEAEVVSLENGPKAAPVELGYVRTPVKRMSGGEPPRRRLNFAAQT